MFVSIFPHNRDLSSDSRRSQIRVPDPVRTQRQIVSRMTPHFLPVVDIHGGVVPVETNFLHDDYSQIGLKEPGVSKPNPHAALHSPKYMSNIPWIDNLSDWPDGVNLFSLSNTSKDFSSPTAPLRPDVAFLLRSEDKDISCLCNPGHNELLPLDGIGLSTSVSVKVRSEQ